MYKNGKGYFPLKLVMAYLIATIFIYVIAPWDFKTVNPVLTYSLLFVYILSFGIGYMMNLKKAKPSNQIMINKNYLMLCFYILLVVNFFVLFIQLMRVNGYSSFNITSLWNKIITGLQNPSTNYYLIQEIYDSNSYSYFMGTIGSLLIKFSTPFSYSIVIVSSVYFKRFNKFGKFFSILNILTYLVKYLTMGTNKGVMDIIIILFSTILLSFFHGDIKIKKKTFFASLATVLIVGITYFNINLSDRYFGKNWMNNYYLSNTIKLKEDPLIFKILPESTQTLIVSLSSYLGQGYYGFSLATDVEWTPMYGIGNSQNKVYSQAVNNPIVMENTLQYKTEQKFGWIAGTTWSSLYSWIANDLSVYGVPIFMFVFGYLFAMAYRDSVEKSNDFAPIIFTYFMIEIFFIPANNQISISSESEASFIFMLLIWLISRKVRIKYE